MYDQMKRHEIEILRHAGFSIRKIAEQTKVGVNTVVRVLREKDPKEQGMERRRPVGRPPIALALQEPIRQILQVDPTLPTVEVLHRLRERGYSGGKNPVYRLVRGLRNVVTPPMVRFEGLAGEFSQNDFGSVHVCYESGPEEILHFFAARLKWSRWVYVEIVPNEQEEALIRALLRSFQSFGGVPLVCVFDNPKTVVISRKGGIIQWNSTFGQVALDYRFGPELCNPQRGQEKGSVENLVGFVKNSFFKVRRFHDRVDLETQLAGWHHEVNEERPCRATDVTPMARMDQERLRLRPLPISPNEYPLRFPVRVGPTGWVDFHGIRYSMPAEAINLNATLFLYPEEVRIVADRHEAQHPRNPFNGVSSLPRHLASGVARVSGRRAELYYQRQRLLEVGEKAEAFLTELVHGRPYTWHADVRVLFSLLLQHGPERMARAFQHALDHGWYGSEHVLELLKGEAET